MRIRDWSSDVCSSDLTVAADSPQQPPAPAPAGAPKARAPHDGEKVIPLEIAESADWRRVCATAVLCDPMGEGEVLYHAKVVASGPPQRDGSWRNVSQKFNHPQAKLAQAAPEIGGLRFTFPSTDRKSVLWGKSGSVR